MTGELLRAVRQTRNGHHGLMERTTRRGLEITIFGDPAAPMVVCVIGESPVDLGESASFCLAVDQPDEKIRHEFMKHTNEYADEIADADAR